jgi:hypothetical protein
MSILIIPVVLCAAYLVMVALCVCERMTAQTNHLIRVLVVLIGGAGFWALCKAVVFGWGSTPEEFVQGIAIVALAIVLWVAPRFNTGNADIQAQSRKASHGR